MKALLAKGKGQLTKAPHGKITMRQLMKPGEKVSNIEITDQNIKALLDTYRIAKGDSGALTTDTRKLFLSISETDFGFTGITKQISEVRSYIPNIMVERPTIEDIMLGNIGGEK